MMPRVSIIIAVKAPNPNLSECLAGCLELDYPDHEIIVCPDEDFAPPDSRIQVLPTGPVGPAMKRDKAAHAATGDVLAFLDDDAFPSREWLSRAAENFADPSVGAVGGPAATPADDPPAAQASGQVYASWAGGGNYAYRYLPQARRMVDDYPTCNLLVRRASFEAVGGFDTYFWPGEDTKLCLDITQGLRQKIVYDPGALVYHHRRPLFGPHLRQVRSYGLHRGYFAKRFPATSLRLSYFLPTAIVLWMTAGWLIAALVPTLGGAYLLSWAVYLLTVAVSAFLTSRMHFNLGATGTDSPSLRAPRRGAKQSPGMVADCFGKLRAPRSDIRPKSEMHPGLSLKLTPYVMLGIMATHLVYGAWFVVGLLSPRLKEER